MPPKKNKDTTSAQTRPTPQTEEPFDQEISPTMENTQDSLQALQDRIASLERLLQSQTRPEQPPQQTFVAPQPAPVKVKLKEPKVFTTDMDIRFWILDIEDNLRERNIPETSKVTYVTSYLDDPIRQRVQRLQIKQDIHVENWAVLKVWLKDNYATSNPTLQAELKISNLYMKPRQTVLDFITEFEALTAEIEWNDAAICHAFRTKLRPDILKQINQAYFNTWPETFAKWKSAAANAESHLAMTRQVLNTQDKRLRFDTPRDAYRIRDPSPARPLRTQKNPDISEQEHWKRYHEGSCTWCGKQGHWFKSCRLRTPTPDTENNKYKNRNDYRSPPPPSRKRQPETRSRTASPAPSPKNSKTRSPGA